MIAAAPIWLIQTPVVAFAQRHTKRLQWDNRETNAGLLRRRVKISFTLLHPNPNKAESVVPTPGVGSGSFVMVRAVGRAGRCNEGLHEAPSTRASSVYIDRRGSDATSSLRMPQAVTDDARRKIVAGAAI